MAAFQRRDQARVVLQHICAGDDINGGGFAQRFAGIESFQTRQFVVASAQNIDRFTQNARTFHGAHRRPDFLPFLSALYRPVDVFAAGGLDGRQHFAVSGVNRLEGFTAGGGNITTVDVKLLFGHSGHGSSIIEKSVADIG